VLTAIENRQVDWLTFTSASTAENFHALLPENLRPIVAEIRKASIGPVTSAAMQKLNWSPAAEATEHTIPGLADALVKAASQSPGSTR